MVDDYTYCPDCGTELDHQETADGIGVRRECIECDRRFAALSSDRFLFWLPAEVRPHAARTAARLSAGPHDGTFIRHAAGFAWLAVAGKAVARYAPSHSDITLVVLLVAGVAWLSLYSIQQRVDNDDPPGRPVLSDLLVVGTPLVLLAGIEVNWQLGRFGAGTVKHAAETLGPHLAYAAAHPWITASGLVGVFAAVLCSMAVGTVLHEESHRLAFRLQGVTARVVYRGPTVAGRTVPVGGGTAYPRPYELELPLPGRLLVGLAPCWLAVGIYATPKLLALPTLGWRGEVILFFIGFTLFVSGLPSPSDINCILNQNRLRVRDRAVERHHAPAEGLEVTA